MNEIPRIEQFTCPCCGGYIGEAAPIAEVEVSISDPQARLLVQILSRRKGRQYRMIDLVNLMYEDDPEGGPDDPRNVLRVVIHRLRKALKPFGWAIHCSGRGSPGEGGLYRLIPMEAGQ